MNDGGWDNVHDRRRRRSRTCCPRRPSGTATPSWCATRWARTGSTSPSRGRRDRLRDRARPDRPRHPAGRPRLAPRQHAPRVDLRSLRDQLRRRRRRPDLPDQLARGVRVGRRATPSPSRSSARTRRRSRRSRPSATSLPNLQHIIVIDARRRHRRRDPARRDPRARPRASTRPTLTRARATPSGPRTRYTFIYTSGTTGPPKGCVLLHGNYRSVLDMVQRARPARRRRRLVYLFLPLAHAFALLIQLGAVDTGTTVAYFGGDTKQIIPELMQVHPTYLPSVPRIFEKLYTLAQGQIPAPVIAAISDARRPDPRPRVPAASRSRRSCRTAGTRRSRATSRAARSRRSASSSRACSAGTCARPSPAPRRSARRSSSSSTARASRSWRATA